MTVTGAPVIAISRGEIIWRDGRVQAIQGRGRFLRCDTPEPAMKLMPRGVLDFV